MNLFLVITLNMLVWALHYFLAEYSSMILGLFNNINVLGGWLFFIIEIENPIINSSIFIKNLFILFLYLSKSIFSKIQNRPINEIVLKNILPLSLAFVIFVLSAIFSFNGIL